MDQRIIFLILLVLNGAFLIAVWHMDVNFMAKKYGQKKTSGAFDIKTEEAHRYSEYAAMAAVLATDLLFIWAFLR